MSQRKEEHVGETFAEGEKVVYHPTGSNVTSVGEIKRIITEPEAVGGRQTVQASEEEPRYVIENLRTHKETGYKAENIVEKVEEQAKGKAEEHEKPSVRHR